MLRIELNQSEDDSRKNYRILIIDDDENITEALRLYFEIDGYEVADAETGLLGLKMFFDFKPDIVLCDLRMPGMDGLEVLDKIKSFDFDIPVIIMTAYNDANTTIEAMKKNALDYFVKPLDFPKLKERCIETLKTKNFSKELIEFPVDKSGKNVSDIELIGKSPLMQKIYKHIGMLSNNNITVLIQGESGTGKELIARVIHDSCKNAGPFIAVNCMALTETLLESELFGHVKGAFTGAIKDKKGKFELAGEGTIFLDEISEMSPALQGKLLRVLQEREFEKVGGEESIKMNARIITATNKNLEKLVESGKFRKDLYYRLKVFTIDVPPLCERKEDIPLLTVHFVNKINSEMKKNVRKIPYEVVEMLQNHKWAGNVRELENTLRQAVVLSKSDVLSKNNIHLSKEPKSLQVPFNKLKSLNDIEKYHIKYVLDNTEWNKKEACKILGISKPTLYSKLKKYNLPYNYTAQ